MGNYVYIPVLIPGQAADFHITIKYIGDKDVSPLTVAALLQKYHRLVPTLVEWHPECWVEADGNAPDGIKEHHVLELKKYDQLIDALHLSLKSLRAEDFPKYRPHITVSKYMWDKVKALHWQPEDLNVMVGTPMYWYKGAPYNLMKLMKQDRGGSIWKCK